MTLVAALLAASVAHAATSEPVRCESGRVVRVRTLERAEGAVGGPSPAAPDERPPSTTGGALHFLTLECGERTWEARVSDEAPGLRPEDLQPRENVSFRIRGHEVFLKRCDGSELETHLVSKTPGKAPPEEPGKEGGANHPRQGGPPLENRRP